MKMMMIYKLVFLFWHLLHLVEMDVVDCYRLSILLRVIQVGHSELEPFNLLVTRTLEEYLDEEQFKLLKCQAHVPGDFIHKKGLEELTEILHLASVLTYRLCLSRLCRYKKSRIKRNSLIKSIDIVSMISIIRSKNV